MEILFAVSDNLWEPLLVVMNSILVNTKREVEFHVLFDNLTEEHQSIIGSFVEERQARVSFYPVDNDMLYKNYTGNKFGLPIESCYRLFAIPLLEHLDKVIYMDVDVVVTDDLGDLWDLDFEDNLLIASESCRVDQTYQKCMQRIHIQNPYVYSGMLVMNLSALREVFQISALLEYFDRYEAHFRWLDMDFINTYFQGRIKVIPPVFHSMCTEIFGAHMSRTRTENALILHWPGTQKPWNTYKSDVYLHDLEIYEKYSHIEVLTDAFKERVKENVNQYKNNIWIPLENVDRYDKLHISNLEVLFDYANQKIIHGNILKDYLKQNNYSHIVLYGINDITKVILDELYQIEDISVSTIIDRSGKNTNFYGVPVMQPQEFIEADIESDVILVMVVNEFMNIRRYLETLELHANLRPIAEMIFSRKEIF